MKNSTLETPSPQPSPTRGEGVNKVVSRAWILRRNMTDAEKALWKLLRNKQFDGVKFRRQQPIGKYIADFVCFEAMLVVELDGGQHAIQQDYDKKRTAFLNEQGFAVLRFWNQDVLKNPDGLYETLKQALAASPSPLVGEGLGEGAVAQEGHNA
ncbi:DUF559 domain-containing protein [bacterium]|nr:DUF559 domain-containing protein [bacterium]